MSKQNYIPLSALVDAIGDALQANFGRSRYRIIAEITDVKVYYQRSYAFLSLVEKEGSEITAAVSAVIWRDHFHLIRDFEKATGVSFAQNLKLVLEVEVQFNSRYGLRISIVGIDETYTLGKLEQDRKDTLNRLVKEHPKSVWMRDGEYRSSNQLLRLPMVMQKIALIAAPGSDGRRDFLHELANNGYPLGYSVEEFPAQVQGDAAAGQIAVHLEKINKIKDAFHTVAIVRGGGGSTDFSAFDDFRVALAVADCALPVFSGIGHERNVSISDLLCHSPQKTPTKCAAGITEHNLEYLAFVQNAGDDIKKRALRMLDHFQQQTKNKETQILKSSQWLITKEKQRLNHLLEKLSAAQPDHILKRGFALVYKDGKHMPMGKSLKQGDSIELRFADTKLKAIIDK